MKEKIKNLLKDLVLGKSIEEITKIYEYSSTQPVKRLIKRYLEKKIIEQIGNNYKLTFKGLNYYQKVTFLDAPKRQIEIHNISYRLTIKNKPKNFLNYVESLILRQGISIEHSGFNDSIMEFTMFGIRIRVTNESIIIFPKPYIYYSTEECLQKSEEFIESIIPRLEALLMIKLDHKGWISLKLSKRHIAFIQNPIAQLVEKNGYRLEVFDEEGRRRLFTDNSSGMYHLESDNVQFGSSDMPKIEEDYLETLKGYSKKKNFNEIKRIERIQEEQKDYTKIILNGLNILTKQTEVLGKQLEINSKILRDLMGTKKQEKIKPEQEDYLKSYLG